MWSSPIIIPYRSRKALAGCVKIIQLGNRDNPSGRFVIDDQLVPQGGETLTFPSYFTSNTQKNLSISS